MEHKRILLVDDHGLFREGLTKIIEQEKGFVVCGAAVNAEEALRQVAETNPDIVLMDISLDGVSGLEVSKQLRAKYPELRILFLSMHKEFVYGERALQAGGNGYVMKSETGETLLTAIRTVLLGKIYASAELSQRILKNMTETKRWPTSPVLRLSRREFEVFRFIGKGLTAAHIAKQLSISTRTVESHKEHIKVRLDLQSNFELHQFAQAWVRDEQE